jgi:phosphoribosylformylglycinamidine (FGAM) synthase-like enzyme
MWVLEMVDDAACHYCAYPQLTAAEEEARKPEPERKYMEDKEAGLQPENPILNWNELGAAGVHKAIMEVMEKKVDRINLMV